MSGSLCAQNPRSPSEVELFVSESDPVSCADSSQNRVLTKVGKLSLPATAFRTGLGAHTGATGYMASVIEYLVAELLESTGNQTRARHGKRTSGKLSLPATAFRTGSGAHTGATVYMVSVIEYLVAELLESTGKQTRARH